MMQFLAVGQLLKLHLFPRYKPWLYMEARTKSYAC
jgi:hypothetical protein